VHVPTVAVTANGEDATRGAKPSVAGTMAQAAMAARRTALEEFFGLAGNSCIVKKMVALYCTDTDTGTGTGTGTDSCTGTSM